MASYLVTGGSGYVGARLVKRLIARGDRVVFLHRRAEQLAAFADESKLIVPLPVSASPADYSEAIRKHNVEAVFHLASKAVYACPASDVASLMEANITLGTQILEAMGETECCRFVNVGTYWQHYDGADYNPICLYAATKQAFMDIATYYAKWRGISCISLKLTDVYGDNDPRPKIFTLIDTAVKTGETLKLTAGEQLVSFLHVEDAVTALCEAAQQTTSSDPTHKFYGVGTTHISLKNAVALYLKIIGEHPSIEWGGIPYRPTQIMTPWLGELLPNWQPAISLEEGLRSLIK